MKLHDLHEARYASKEPQYKCRKCGTRFAERETKTRHGAHANIKYCPKCGVGHHLAFFRKDLREAKYRSSHTWYTKWVKEQMEKMKRSRAHEFIETDLPDLDEIRTAVDDLTAGLGKPEHYTETNKFQFWRWEIPRTDDSPYKFFVIVNSYGELFVERADP